MPAGASMRYDTQPFFRLFRKEGMRSLCFSFILCFFLLNSAQCLYAQASQDSILNKAWQKKADSNLVRKSITLNDSLSIALKDSSKVKVRHHSPKMALLLSAVLPGLGQAYNKKYWKIPIIYAGLGGLSYLIYFEDNKYQCYRNAYIYQVDGDPLTKGICNGRSDVTTLETLKNYYRRNRDLAISGMALWYALNLVDAVVDGHLYHFDVSDNISLNWRPDGGYSSFGNQHPSAYVGLKLTLHL